MNRFLKFIVLSLILNSCGKNIKPTTDTNLTIKQFKTELLRTWFFEEADSTSIIALETNDECLLGHITKIYPIDGYLIIYDRSSGIYLFDKNGGFINEIGKKGGDLMNIPN